MTFGAHLLHRTSASKVSRDVVVTHLKKIEAAQLTAGNVRKKAFHLLACSIFLASCGGAYGKPSLPESHSSNTNGSTITVEHASRLGMVLATSKGQTLYELLSDNGKSIQCGGACASIWPPYLISNNTAKPTSAPGVHAVIGTVEDTNGTIQLTVNGNPVYTYASDNGAGAADGEDIRSFGGIWKVLDLSGSPAHATTVATSGGNQSSKSWG